MRTINLGADRDAVYTLAYEIRLDTGERVRIVRELNTRGIEILGHPLSALGNDDVANIAVTDRFGEDVTFDFGCFCGKEPTTLDPVRRHLARRLLTFIPQTAA